MTSENRRQARPTPAEVRAAMELVERTVSVEEAEKELRVPQGALKRWREDGLIIMESLPPRIIEGLHGPRYDRETLIRLVRESPRRPKKKAKTAGKESPDR